MLADHFPTAAIYCELFDKNFPFKVIHRTGKFAVARVVFSEIIKDNSSLAADDDDTDDDCDHVCCRRDVYSNHCSSLFLLYYSFHKTSTEIKNKTVSIPRDRSRLFPDPPVSAFTEL